MAYSVEENAALGGIQAISWVSWTEDGCRHGGRRRRGEDG